MHGLPRSFDPTFFVGRQMEMVCFNENQVYLHFDHKISIVIEAALRHEYGSGCDQVDSMPVTTSRLMRLLGAEVRNAKATIDGTLTLQFDNGDRLTCFDTSRSFESYRIQRGTEMTIV